MSVMSVMSVIFPYAPSRAGVHVPARALLLLRSVRLFPRLSGRARRVVRMHTRGGRTHIGFSPTSPTSPTPAIPENEVFCAVGRFRGPSFCANITDTHRGGNPMDDEQSIHAGN